MKKLNLLFAILAIATIGFISTGCGEEEAVGPTIVLTSDGLTADATVSSGETFTLAWSATKGDANLASLTITREGVNLTGYPDADIDKDVYAGSATITAPTAVGDYVHSVIIEDADGLTDEVSLTITVEAAETPLTDEFTAGVIGHYFGPLDGAWDLVANDSKVWADAEGDKDMKNLSASSGSTFISGFEAGNATRFVKANTLDYATVTAEGAAAAYAAGTAADNIGTVSVGDIIVAKLRGGTDYAVIEITLVNPTFKSAPLAGDGKIEFKYKK